MKVLLLADLQIEAGLSLGHGEYGPGSRFHDQEQALHRIADIADEEGVELAILAGDTFDRPKPAPWAILAMQEFLERMPHTLLLSGNHDCKSLALPSVLNCLAHERVDVVMEPRWIDFADLRVSMLPWMPLGAFANGNAPTDRDELNAYVGMRLGQEAQRLGALGAGCGKPHILVGHWSISGGVTGTGVGVEVFREPVIPLGAIETAGFDMVAFGHIHLQQVLHREPPVLYLGGPLVNSFGEAGGHHGVWLYDTEGPEMRFVPVPDRKFVTYDDDFTDGGDFSMLQEGYDPKVGDWDGAVVRIRYTATEEQARRVDHAAVKDAALVAGAHKVFGPQPTLIRKERARVEAGAVLDLTPERAIDMYVETTDGTPEQAARARALHAEYAARL